MQRVVHEVVQLVRLRHSVDAEQAGVLVACVEGGQRVRQVLLANVLAQAAAHVAAGAHGAVPAAQHALHDHEGEGVR